LSTLLACRTAIALVTLGPLRALKTAIALVAFFSFVTLRALWTLRSLLACRAGIALVALNTRHRAAPAPDSLSDETNQRKHRIKEATLSVREVASLSFWKSSEAEVEALT